MKRLVVYVKNNTWRLLIVLPATSKGRTGAAAPNQVSQDRITAAENDHSLKHLYPSLGKRGYLNLIGLTQSGRIYLRFRETLDIYLSDKNN